MPTYNRPSTLRRQLDALTWQRVARPGRVRILVNGNRRHGSPTRPRRREYGIEVRSNLANISANANIALAFVFVRPRGCLWILSDDDTVRAWALQTIARGGYTPSLSTRLGCAPAPLAVSARPCCYQRCYRRRANSGFLR